MHKFKISRNIPTNKLVSNQNNDVMLKYLTEAFKDTALKIYGLDMPKIVGVEPTVIPYVEVKQKALDFLFKLEDDTYLHLEFATTFKTEDIYRFMLYDARVIQAKQKKVRTAVIYSGSVKNAPEVLDGGSIYFNVNNVYMNTFDGDTIYEHLQNKVMESEHLDKEDILNFVFLPLMKNTLDKNKTAIRAADLAQKIKDKEQQRFCIGAILGLADKYLDEEYVKKLWEVLKMNSVVLELNRLAVEEERQAAAKRLEEALNASHRQVAKNMLLEGADIEFVAKVTGMALDEVRGLKREMDN